jgi:hypothetical protein
MALQTQYILGEDDGIEYVYENAYLKIVKVITSNTDYEFFETVNDPNNPNIKERLSWINRLETDATVYVWSDTNARKNRAQVIHWFSFSFEYDLTKSENIFQQGYAKLKFLFENTKDV